MYLLSIVAGIASYFVSRGPDGRLMAFFATFTVIGALYVGLAWITRHQPIWPHLLAHLACFGVAVAIGMSPKPRLDEMAGMMYFFAPAFVIGMIVLGCVARFLARWI